MNDYNYEAQAIYSEHAASKRKMILGIVFTAIGYCILMFWFGMFVEDPELGVETSIPFMIFWGPSLGFGIPFLVKGIIGVVQNNKKLNALKKQSQNTATPVGYVPPQPVYQPAPQPMYQPAPPPVQPAPQPVQPVPQPMNPNLDDTVGLDATTPLYNQPAEQTQQPENQ